MRLLILSDLHFEFHDDKGASLLEALPPAEDVDVCVLAGDIAVAEGIPAALRAFCERYGRVLYVHGNHEFYGSDRASVFDRTQRAVDEHKNLVWLQLGTTEIDGRRFVGAPLWFARSAVADRLKSAMNDFAMIHDFESWVYEENSLTGRFLTDEVRAGDVVVTHHLPSFRSVHPRYAGNPLNAFFVCDLEALVEDARPTLWIHGHSHTSADYRLGATRVVSNPFGYAGYDENPSFDVRKIIEL